MVAVGGTVLAQAGKNTLAPTQITLSFFPKGLHHAGVFELQGKDVTIETNAGRPRDYRRQTGPTAKLIPDTADKTTLVEMGSLRFHVIVRGERIGVRAEGCRRVRR